MQEILGLDGSLAGDALRAAQDACPGILFERVEHQKFHKVLKGLIPEWKPDLAHFFQNNPAEARKEILIRLKNANNQHGRGDVGDVAVQWLKDSMTAQGIPFNP